MGSLDNLASVRVSDGNAGSRASDRFSYQVDWGMRKLLELEEKDEDYIMIMDYHDDIVICNSEKQQDFIDFFQIKTKESAGEWGLKSLAGKKTTKSGGESNSCEDSKLSILAKLLKHTQDFNDSRFLYFVTNSRLSSNLYSKSNSEIAFEDLDDDYKGKIKDYVRKELGDITDEAFDKLIFLQNQMSVNGHEDYLKGALSSFLKTKFQTVVDIPEIYETLFAMMMKCTNYEGDITSKEDLIKHKSITHDAFRKYLEGVTILKSYDDIVQRIMTEITDVVSYPNRKHLKAALKELSTDILNYENDVSLVLIPLIRNAMLEVNIDEVNNLWEHANIVYDDVIGKYVNYNGYSEHYIKAAILYAIQRFE